MMNNKSNEKQGCLTAIFQLFNPKKQGEETLPGVAAQGRVDSQYFPPKSKSRRHFPTECGTISYPRPKFLSITYSPRSFTPGPLSVLKSDWQIYSS